MQDKAAGELGGQFAGWRLSLPRFVAAWRRWLQGFLRRELMEVSEAERAMFCEPLEKARTHLGRTVRAFQDRLAAHVRGALGVTLSPRELVLDVGEPSAPPVDVGYGFDVALDIIGYMVPMALFRGPVERVLTRKARWEVEKNFSRLAAGWGKRVGDAIAELTRQAERQAADELEALEGMAAHTGSEEARLRRAAMGLEEIGEWPTRG
jgi:hypothetical protein